MLGIIALIFALYYLEKYLDSVNKLKDRVRFMESKLGPNYNQDNYPKKDDYYVLDDEE